MGIRGSNLFASAWLCCGLAFFCAHGGAQQPGGPPQAPSGTNIAPTFQVNVNRVLVPVVVRDKQGRSVNDLKKEDFEVLDDGKPRPISGFAVDQRGLAAQTTESGAPSPAAATAAPEAAPESTPESASGAQRFIVFLFDDLHMNPEELAHVQKAGEKALDSTLTGSDIAAVVSISGKTNSGLTRDRATLQQALMSLQARDLFRTDTRDCPLITYYQAVQIEREHNDQGPAFQDAFNQVKNCNPGLDPTNQQYVIENEVTTAANRVLNMGRQDAQITYANLTAFVRTMAKLPGQRLLILVSPGFLPIEQESIYAESQLIDLAAQSNVTVCALDARGLYTAELNASQDTPGGAGQQSDFKRTSMLLAEGSMASLADGTGGAFFHNNNDFDAGFKQLADAPESVYLLELSLDKVKPDDKFHRLKVKVDRAGLDLEARRGYFLPKPEKHKKK